MIDLAPFLPGFIAAYAILLIGAASPGPSVAMLIGIATDQGRAPAMVATLGIAMGSVVINILTLLGVGLILSQAAWAMTGLKLIGAAYLLWLAYGAFRKALHPPALRAAGAVPRSPWRHFVAGFLLQVTNPKAIVFWLAIASIGATAGGGIGIVSLFVVGAFLISFSCHGAWALALSAAPVRRVYTRARRWVELTLGSFFTFAAFKLATSEG
ncbi:LysE family translocator [Roseovarius pelagicus]|uniref:LysE family translocator n=1 Tax=Roseovarius pelagicus TaxID=2980108 RepID=A0ABY6DFX4_9RHOB|nr:LysE family translocator [Roseovarius pelagicus]UXX85013.1 LysE family translocator [Roseovarius pelagicus]